MPSSLLWEPLFESAAQTLAGAIGSYTLAKLKTKLFQRNKFDGAMDLWSRGIGKHSVGQGETVRLDCLISPYSQLFPNDPMSNGKRWNQLYDFEGKISSTEYQSMEFFAGSDAALRMGRLNGETVVGIYDRYGFIGEGFVGVVSTKLLTKAVPEFFQPSFFGIRAMIKGRLELCPSQHGFLMRGIAKTAGMRLRMPDYRNVWYLQVASISPFLRSADRNATLLGSVWNTTDIVRNQYAVQYGYLNNDAERLNCIEKLHNSPLWSNAQVYFDSVRRPVSVDGFKERYFG